jgi:adenylate cyclase
MHMTVTYSSLIAEAKTLISASADELDQLLCDREEYPEPSEADYIPLSPDALRAAVRLSNRVAVIAGLIAHGRLKSLAASLRAFCLLAAKSPKPSDVRLLFKTSMALRDTAAALEAAPGYGEMLRPSGTVLRPPVGKDVPVLELCRRLGGGSKVALTAFDGRFAGEDRSGVFRMSVDRGKADASRSAGKWLSLVYFDSGSAGENGPLGLTETANALIALIARGELFRYGGLSMSYSALSELGAILPCYCLMETSREPAFMVSCRLPAARLLKVVSSPDKAFIPEPGSGGPDASAFRLFESKDEGDFLSMEEEAEERPPAPELRQSEPLGAAPEASAEIAHSPTIELIEDELSVPDMEGLEDIGFLAPPRIDPDRLDKELPPGIVFPEMPETEDEGLRLDDFKFVADEIGGESGTQANGTDEMAALLGKDGLQAPQPETETRIAAAEDYGTASGGGRRARIEITKDMRIRLPIAIKLMFIISLLLFTALGTMIGLASYFFRQEIRNQVSDANVQISEVMRQKFDNDFIAVSEKAQRMAQSYMSRSFGLDEGGKAALRAELFGADREILYVAAFPEGQAKPNAELANSSALSDYKLGDKALADAVAGRMGDLEQAFKGEAVCLNLSPLFREPCVLAAWNYKSSGGNGALVAVFGSRERLQQSVESKGKSIRQQQLLSMSGEVIAHPDSNLVLQAQDVSGQGLYREISKSQANAGQFRYSDPNGLSYSATYSRLRGMGAWAVSAVEEKRAFEAVGRVQRNNILLALMVLSMAVLLAYFYAKSLTIPIRALVGAARLIEAGKFELSLKARAHDELGLLTNTFVAMGKGLAERERLKDTFGKFVNKDIAEQAQRGTLKLGGERKDATIFFSDIRGFTSISEKLEPEEVVDFLNRYMTRMVKCVNATGGVVDKYIGDAIMAIWGVPPVPGVNDAANAVNAALMMRKELIAFNRDRGGPHTPIIRIGCGINSGPVIAGQIGSNERMEYTVIGDSVNLASRIEALNKPFGSDILVSQDTYSRISGEFRMERMKPITVKGKAEAQQIYAVLGRLDDPLCPRSLSEVQSLLGIEHKDLAAVNVEEEEVKYKIAEEPKAGKGR